MAAIVTTPAVLDLKLYAGDGFTLGFTFTDKDTAAPYPVPGAWAAQIRAPSSAADVLEEFTVDDTDAATGRIAISLTGDQVRAVLGVKSAKWDLQYTAAGAEPHTWYTGAVTVTQDVTRA